MSRYGWISFSLISCQMMRVISSPSISTTGFATLIFAIADRTFLKVARTGREGFRRGPYSTQNWTAKAAMFSSDGMTSQRQQPAARRERSIPRRPRAIVKPLIRHDKVAAARRALPEYWRWLFVDIEARVD